MSYEGYSQFLCKDGHYWTEDAMNLIYNDEVQICPKCKKTAIWENMVNLTNGSFDEDEVRIDNFVKLEVATEISGRCNCCGNKHICEKTYKIPEDNRYSEGDF